MAPCEPGTPKGLWGAGRRSDKEEDESPGHKSAVSKSRGPNVVSSI